MLYASIGFAFIFAFTITSTFTKEIGSFLLFILSFLIVLQNFFIPLILIGIAVIMDVLFKDSYFVDNCLAFYIRKYALFFRWILAVILLIFIVTLLILIINLVFGSAENFVSATQKYGLTLFISLVIFIFLLTLWAHAHLIKPPKLLSSLANEVNPELMASDPESAIRKAFIFFENSLKNKAGPDFLEADDKISNLIGRVYSKSGILTHEKQEAISNLMRGAYGLYRNDLAHNDKRYSLQQAHYILMLVDDLVKRLDESKLKQLDSPSDN